MHGTRSHLPIVLVQVPEIMLFVCLKEPPNMAFTDTVNLIGYTITMRKESTSLLRWRFCVLCTRMCISLFTRKLIKNTQGLLVVTCLLRPLIL